MSVDFKSVLNRAEFYKPAISRFLRDMIEIPSESCQEKEIVLYPPVISGQDIKMRC